MKTIWAKLALKISLALFVVLTAIGALDVYSQYQKDKAVLQAKEERLLQQLVLISGAPVYNLDLNQIEEILSIYLKDESILAIKVVDNNRILKYLGKASMATEELVDLTQQQVTYPTSVDLKSGEILHKGESLGSIDVLFSRRTLYTQMQRTALFAAGALSLALLIVSLMALLLIKTYVTRHLLELVHVAQNIAAGNVNILPKKITSADEIGQLFRAMHNMIAYIKNVAEVAEHVANQQLQIPITPRSEHDLLNHSLQKMVSNLQHILAQNAHTLRDIEQQNWLNDGLNQLNAALAGQGSLEEICRRAVSFAARYVNAGWGVLYSYDAEQSLLTLRGTFAFTENDHVAHTYRVGEGIPGQVALERAPIVLTNLQGKNYRVNTGIISEQPLTTYTAPLMYNHELYGVLELASFEEFDDRRQRFLNEANQVLATVIFSALQRERVQELLRASEQAILEAEAAEQVAQQQRKEVQKANTLLEEQQQRLQQQSEEMQQINAHLEEQQQQLQQQSEEFRQQNTQLQLAKEDTAQRAQRLEHLQQQELDNFSRMYHALQEPVQTIILRSQEASARNTDTLSSEDRRQLTCIQRAGQEIHHVLTNMLELRKIESGNLTIAPSRCSTADLLKACERQFEIEAKEKDNEFFVQDTFQATLHSDQEKLLSILHNLLALAFHFTRNGSITFTASPHPSQPDMVQFSVTVAGSDFPLEKYQHLLTSYEERDISISKDVDLPQVEGAIAREYAKILGGTLDVHSKPDHTVHIVLTMSTTPEWPEQPEEREHLKGPYTSAKEDESRFEPENRAGSRRARDERLPASSADKNSLAGKKILLVDDDIKNVFVLASALENQGATVIDAQNGKLALEMLRQDDEIDMVLLDVMMPVMDGYTAMREIRNDEHLAHLPIIALTAKTSQQERQKCLEAGANEYLSKPVDYESFIHVIHAWLEKK